jgi:hypothetical protein
VLVDGGVPGLDTGQRGLLGGQPVQHGRLDQQAEAAPSPAANQISWRSRSSDISARSFRADMGGPSGSSTAHAARVAA